MTPIRSILTLATVVCSVLVPVSLGYALASHGTRPVIAALIFLLAAAGLGFAITRGGRGPEPSIRSRD
jgi:hypothetical protein